MVDIIALVLAKLKASSSIGAAFGTRIYGMHLPENVKTLPAVVVIGSGGESMEEAPVIDGAIYIHVWAETSAAAMSGYGTVHDVLRAAEHEAVGSNVIMTAVEEVAAMPIVDEKTMWWRAIGTWVVSGR